MDINLLKPAFVTQKSHFCLNTQKINAISKYNLPEITQFQFEFIYVNHSIECQMTEIDFIRKQVNFEKIWGYKRAIELNRKRIRFIP